jgi:hypothetical protein
LEEKARRSGFSNGFGRNYFDQWTGRNG